MILYYIAEALSNQPGTCGARLEGGRLVSTDGQAAAWPSVLKAGMGGDLEFQKMIPDADERAQIERVTTNLRKSQAQGRTFLRRYAQ